MTLPNLLIVGAEKCGTTALFAQLGAHPQVFMAVQKEPSYFLASDPLFVSQKMPGGEHPYVRTLAEYEALFDGTQSYVVRGEASPCYLYSKVAPAKIHEAVPDAKIVIMLRNPAERAYSQFLYNVRQGWEPEGQTFESALALEDERVAANEMWAFHYVRRSRYCEQVRRYAELFGDRVRVWLYDDYSRDPAGVLSELQVWLGIERGLPADLHERHNPTSLHRSSLVHRLTERPSPVQSLAKRLLAPDTRAAMLRRIRSWNEWRPQPPVDSMMRVTRCCAADIESLAALIAPDPRIWLRNAMA
jgi:hypothetical protein